MVITPFPGMAKTHEPTFSGSAVLWPVLSQVGASRLLAKHE